MSLPESDRSPCKSCKAQKNLPNCSLACQKLEAYQRRLICNRCDTIQDSEYCGCEHEFRIIHNKWK